MIQICQERQELLQFFGQQSTFIMQQEYEENYVQSYSKNSFISGEIQISVFYSWLGWDRRERERVRPRDQEYKEKTQFFFFFKYTNKYKMDTKN